MILKTPLARAIGLAVASNAMVATAQEAAPQAQLEEIIVTGTRLATDTFSSSSPVEVVSSDEALLQGINDVGRLLHSSTIASGSAQITTSFPVFGNSDGGRGAQTLSLRGLGAQRTLVLLNNRRAGPAGIGGSVAAFDLSALPISVIDRVEILKDGASSIYGSDAIAGVVNIITKKTEGIIFDGYFSQPSESGGEESSFNVTWGNVGERGSVQLSMDVYKQTELAGGQRDNFACGEQYFFRPDSGERADLIDPRTGRYKCTGALGAMVWLFDFQDPETSNVPQPTGLNGTKIQYDYDGDLGNYAEPLAVDPANPEFLTVPPGWFPVFGTRERDGYTNAHHPIADTRSIVPETERSTVYLEAEREFGDRLEGYMEVLLNRRKTANNGGGLYWTFLYNRDGGGGFPPNSSPTVAGWGGNNWLNPVAVAELDNSVDVDYRRLVAGLHGDISDDWSWDLSYQRSESDGEYIQDIIYDDAIAPSRFATSSCVGTVTPVRGVPCIDIPWLDPDLLYGIVSPDVREFLFGVDIGSTVYEQDTIEGFVSGLVGNLPGGPIGIVGGFQLQDDSIRDVPGEQALLGNVWLLGGASVTEGQDSTTAYFTEIQLPVADSVTVNGSMRYTDVDSYGSDTTYKLGLSWQVTDAWRVRANTGTSFRAPALFELFLNDQVGGAPQRQVDPCIQWETAVAAGGIPPRVAQNCAAEGIPADFGGAAIPAITLTGGGLGRLRAETSESDTIGVVWQPPGTNLSVSVDYFEILVENEVTRVGAENIVFQCYNSLYFPDDPLCDLFDRSVESGIENVGGINNVQDDYLNIARQKNEGVDWALRWATSRAWGDLTLNARLNIQHTDVRALFAETEEDLNGEIGEPERVGQLNLSLKRGNWTYYWGLDYIGSADNYESFGGNETMYRDELVRIVLHTDPVQYHTFSFARELPGRQASFRIGVANAFDEKPPRVTTWNGGEVPTQGQSVFVSQYDWFGRRVFANFTKTWGN